MINEKLKLLPDAPGCYLHKDINNNIIYVGKAKNLKKRVKSYFNGSATGKTLMLVNDIVDFEYIITSSELESLILEINLIKKYNPKYNILLKDDKTYPYIELTNDKCPTLKVVRNVNKKRKKNNLFGPYPNVTSARNTVDLLNRIYPLKKCNNLGSTVCLYYHIGECLGYCRNNIDNNQVNNMIKEITSFLNGNSNNVINIIKSKMNEASDNLNFERAMEYKTMLDSIMITLREQKIDLGNNEIFDVFNYYQHNNFLSIQVFFIRGGIILGRDKKIIPLVDEVSEEFEEYIIRFYEKNSVIPKRIIVPVDTNTDILCEYLHTNVMIAKKGKIKKILELVRENAKNELDNNEEILNKKENIRLDAINDLKEILNTDRVSRIEAFDNSHLFGTFYVGGMVVYEDFIPLKGEYRKFKVAVSVKDDLTAMREVIYRRYYRVLYENLKSPDLIIVDGGIEQVKVAKEVIDSLGMNINIIGLKKDNKHNTNSIINNSLEEIPLKGKSNLFIFLSKIQDDVHKYAINYHRTIKSKGMFSSVLDIVPGIGEVKKKLLLKSFPSMKKLKEASIEELERVLDKKSAESLLNYLKEL